ncbi:uncharacterized protein LOC123525537 [Mercenaria mercenaria]|uniref:uncharacterized protein LOC123525537 n=1 Tax=Mercenaria mercenaria TaxID=6596 RepID=UPI00234F52EC|nr:uncharacterized protein LOC123525537 [Mercenaria mercenaria]
MEGGKARGNYASAYKLSRSTINQKALRRERRSIEQKELRHGEINKRRNLCDLSPLQEGDLTATQDKSYKDKTPQKPRANEKAKKGMDRLEQLKKWKEERERKRKMEEEEYRKKNPVFRVSKAVDHADTRLFGKSATKKHPVKPKPAPVGKPISHTGPASHHKQVTHSKPASQTSSASKPNTENRSRQLSGKRQAAGYQHTTTTKEKTNKKVEKAPVSTTRSLRSSRQPAPEPTSRTTRQKAKSKAIEFEAAAVPESSFGFNASSFVFRPLSPTSAAGFLCPNPDSSCVSFLETNPKRSSTPKKDQEKKSKADETCSDKTAFNQTDTSLTQNITHMNSTTIEQSEKTVVDTPGTKNRSVRRSRRSVKCVDSDVNTIKDQTNVPTETAKKDLEKEETPRRKSRRSVVSVVNEEKEELKNLEKVKTTPRRSLRRSVLSVNSEVEEGTKSEEDVQKPRRSTRRRSAAASVSSDSDAKETESGSPVKNGRSLRSSVASVGSDSENIVEKITPKNRRKSRRSVALVHEPEILPEISEDADTSNGSSDVFEDNTDEDKENSGPARKTDAVHMKPSSDSGVDLAIPLEEKTPTNKKTKKGRHKSFGGFRLPDAESVVLSARRNPRRKTLMPKSPEEWIEVLSNSPMVEMSRRKHKYGNTSLPTLDFDNIDLEEPNSAMVTEGTEVKASEAGSESPQGVAMEGNEVSPVAMDILNESNKENEPQAELLTETNDQAVVQVGEVSSTQDGPLNEDSSSDSEQDVPYFRKLLCTETNRLNGLSDHWNLINEKTELTEEVHGQIRTTVGQAKLLMNQRFKQFSGLVDNCEFKLGEKETTCMDLKGFWEMIYYQVEDVDKKFDELTKLKENNWVDDKPKPAVQKIKKKVSKPVVSKPAVKSKFAAFRAQMKKQKESVSSPVAQKVEEEKVFEVPGFFTVASPVRSPKPHCEGGTPRKPTPTFSSAENKISKDTLVVQSSSEMLANRTPSRKSYIPAVPSPLLKDTTPLPRPTRTCTQKTPLPKRIIDEVDRSEHCSESESKRVKRTPARRSLRPRKSVNFADEISVGQVSSPTVEGTDADFARLLQPMTEEPAGDKAGDVLNDSLSRYLQPLSSLEKEDTPKQGRSRRTSLKGCRSTERRRSRQRSVHFVSPTAEETSHIKLPHTPYNRDSLVKQKRVTRKSQQLEEDIFSIDNIDNDENVPPPSFRSPRPSLLGTPPDMKRREPNTSAYVPTGTLISFTP